MNAPRSPFARSRAELRRSLRPRGPGAPRCRVRGWLKDANVEAHARLMAARTAPDALAAKDESNLLIELARPLEDFVGALFGVTRRGGGAARDARRRLRRSTTASGCSCSATSRAPSSPTPRRRSTVRRTVDAAGADRGRSRSVGARLRAEGARAGRRGVQGRDADARDRGAGALRRLGAAQRRGQGSAIATGRCSRCRTSSTSSISCRSRPRWSTASRA